MAIVNLILDVKDQAYIDANPTKVLALNVPIYRSDGMVAFGDGTTPLSGLTFLPLFSAEWGSLSGQIENQTDLINYIQSSINTVIRDRGNYDASIGIFPTTGGSGPGGSVELGNQWTISVSGILGGEVVSAPYDTIRALKDNPSDDRGDWYIQHSSAPVIIPGHMTITKITSSATISPYMATERNMYIVTALATDANITQINGGIGPGSMLILRIKDNGTARALSFSSYYRFSPDLPAPTTTVISKELYLGLIYNEVADKMDCIAILNNI